MEITFGAGKVLCAGVKRDGIKGLILRPVRDAREINEIEPDWADGDRLEICPDDVLIWATSLEGARVLQDRVNILCLELDRHKVTDVRD